MHSYPLAVRASYRTSVNQRPQEPHASQRRNEAQIMGSKGVLIIATAVILALTWCSPFLSAQTRASTTEQSDEAARVENAVESDH